MKFPRLLTCAVPFGLLISSIATPSVSAATAPIVTWKVSSLTAGQILKLSAVASTNSPGVKTWSKRGSCTLTPQKKPTRLTMGSSGSCTLSLRVTQSGKYSALNSTRTITQTAPTLYRVGQTGPDGVGTIFYVDMARPKGSQYFEVACIGWSDGTCGGTDLTYPRAEWGCYGANIPGADGTAIGTGEQNTSDILASCATVGIAAQLADVLVLGGQSDWFLPSKDELNQMYVNKEAQGGFPALGFWSSSEHDADDAWLQNFDFGLQRSFIYKDSDYSVLPVRAF